MCCWPTDVRRTLREMSGGWMCVSPPCMCAVSGMTSVCLSKRSRTLTAGCSIADGATVGEQCFLRVHWALRATVTDNG